MSRVIKLNVTETLKISLIFSISFFSNNLHAYNMTDVAFVAGEHLSAIAYYEAYRETECRQTVFYSLQDISISNFTSELMPLLNQKDHKEMSKTLPFIYQTRGRYEKDLEKMILNLKKKGNNLNQTCQLIYDSIMNLHNQTFLKWHIIKEKNF